MPTMPEGTGRAEPSDSSRWGTAATSPALPSARVAAERTSGERSSSSVTRSGV